MTSVPPPPLAAIMPATPSSIGKTSAGRSPARVIVSDLVQRTRSLLAAATRDAFFAETVLLARIGPGGLHHPHADNSRQDADGNWVPNHTPMRHYSTIAYISEEFEGGEIRFLDQDLSIRPRTGLLVAFPSDHRYVHEVVPVRSGVRYTLPIWYTRAEDRATADLK